MEACHLGVGAAAYVVEAGGDFDEVFGAFRQALAPGAGRPSIASRISSRDPSPMLRPSSSASASAVLPTEPIGGAHGVQIVEL